MTTHNRDKIVASAKEAGVFNNIPLPQLLPLERFYAIAFETGCQAEREECAKLCESTYPEYGGANPYCFETPSECAEAIRARGDTK